MLTASLTAGLLARHGDWQARGACRSVDPELFFSPDADRGPARASREDAAKRVCRRCPVVRDCARYALASGERYGVWGGMTEAERRRISAPFDAGGLPSGGPLREAG